MDRLLKIFVIVIIMCATAQMAIRHLSYVHALISGFAFGYYIIGGALITLILLIIYLFKEH